MRRFSPHSYPLMVAILLLCGLLTACASNSTSPAMNDFNSSITVTVSPAATVIPSPENDFQPSTTPVPDQKSNLKGTASLTPAPDNPDKEVLSIMVRQESIFLGETVDSVLQKLGHPNRIDTADYSYDYYIYNNDYSRLVFVIFSHGKVVGFYTDSLDFDFKGIHSGSGIQAVNEALGSNFHLEEVLTETIDPYTIHILIDKLGTQKVTGIYVLAEQKQQGEYSNAAVQGIEHMVYDLTNSIRVRNHEAILSWSSSAALSARKHSTDMAENNFFNHIGSFGRKPGDRMRAEGIYYTTCGENIIAGYGTAILSTHGWFNSEGHRKNLLNTRFRYLGVGFAYLPDSKYQTYLTQDFYR